MWRDREQRLCWKVSVVPIHHALNITGTRRLDGVQHMNVRWEDGKLNKDAIKSSLSKTKLFMQLQTDPRVFSVIVLQVSETIYFSSVAAGTWFLHYLKKSAT